MMIRAVVDRLRRAVKPEPEHPRLPALRAEVRRAGDMVRELDRWRDSYRRRLGRLA